MMKMTKIILGVAAALFCVLPARAVTDKEMEEARTITAKLYLRYANNGSGYLDDLSPKTMAELTSKLKEKEKENLKAFNSVAVPKDYASWDKAKLTEFWGVTFFTSPALSAEGKVAKTRVKQKIAAMTIAAPATAETQPAAETPAKPETPKEEQAAETAANEIPMPTAETAEAEQQDILADQKAIEKDAEESAGRIRNEGSHTWVYIVVLLILIGVVIWLVMIAANMMKRSPDGEESPTAADNDELREKARTAITRKNEEIGRLQERLEISENTLAARTQEVERLRGDNARLSESLAESRAENARLTASLEEGRRGAQRMAARPATEHVAERPHPAPSAPTSDADQSRRQVLKVIYLGRANARGLFVRADRRLSPGNSFFRLDTEDGIVGTFRLVDDMATLDMALDQPNHYLAGGCTGPELDDTADVTAIETVAPGKAVFENGCWRVIRKTQIRYIRE